MLEYSYMLQKGFSAILYSIHIS